MNTIQVENNKNLTQRQKDLENEKAKSNDLQSKLSELLVQQPQVVHVDPPVKPELVGEGQLQDVNPAAVRVVKKDSLGKYHGFKVLSCLAWFLIQN